MRLGQTSFVYFVSKFFGSIIGFFATIYFARILGETVLGQYALAITIVTWLTIIGNVGFGTAITKRVSEGREPEQYLGAGMIIMSSMMAVVLLFTFLFRLQIDAYVGAPVSKIIMLLLLVTLYKSLVNALLKGSHLVHIYAVLSTTKLALRAISQVALVALIGLGLTGMLYGYAFGYFVAATIGLFILKLRPAIPSYEHIKSLFDYAKYSWLGNIESKTFDTADIAILGFFVTQGFVGVYSIAWSLGKFLNIFGNAVSNSFFPEMSKVANKKNPEAITHLIEDTLSFAGLILIPGLVGSLVIGDRLMAVYGEGFIIGTEVLVILIAGLLIYTYNTQLLNTLNAIDRPDLAFRSNLVFILMNIALNFILVWQIGWVGAAIATVLSSTAGLCFAFYYTRQQVAFRVPINETGRQWIAAISMGVIVYVFRIGIEIQIPQIAAVNEIFVVLLVIVGSIAYFLILFVIWAQFRDTVVNNLPTEIQ